MQNYPCPISNVYASFEVSVTFLCDFMSNDHRNRMRYELWVNVAAAILFKPDFHELRKERKRKWSTRTLPHKHCKTETKWSRTEGFDLLRSVSVV